MAASDINVTSLKPEELVRVARQVRLEATLDHKPWTALQDALLVALERSLDKETYR